MNQHTAIGWLGEKQYTRDDEPTISCINQDKDTDNEVYYVDLKGRQCRTLNEIYQKALEFLSFRAAFTDFQFTNKNKMFTKFWFDFVQTQGSLRCQRNKTFRYPKTYAT